MGARAWRRASSVAMCSVNWSTSAWRVSLSDTSLVEGKRRVSVRDACLLSRHEALVERGGCLARAFDPHVGPSTAGAAGREPRAVSQEPPGVLPRTYRSCSALLQA